MYKLILVPIRTPPKQAEGQLNFPPTWQIFATFRAKPATFCRYGHIVGFYLENFSENLILSVAQH